MDFSKYTTYVCFYKMQAKFDEDFNTPLKDELVKVHECLAKVQYSKAQEYNVKEQEEETCVIKVQWHPLLNTATHVEVKTFYSTDQYQIEIQQMPFADGEVEMKCKK